MNIFHCLGLNCLYKKTHKSASVNIFKLSPSSKDQRALHMLHGIMGEQEYCLYYRDSLPINLLSLVPKP